MKIFKFLTVLTVVALAGANFGFPAQAAPSANKFVMKASEAGMFEIESSKLALDKSQNDDIKKFAQQMIDDHTAANDNLKSTLSSANLDDSQLATKLTYSHQQIINRLKIISSSKDFDKEYVSAQKDAHKDAVKLFKSYSKNGDNDALKSFAAKTLPTLQQHLDHVKQLSSSM